MPNFRIARTCTAAGLALLTALGAAAQDHDPLKSTECRRALDALQVREGSAASAPKPARPADPYEAEASAPALERARRDAARICLGGKGDPERPAQHIAVPPISVAPVTARPASPAPSVVPQAVLRPVPAAPSALDVKPRPAPPIVTACDATGCWASDGSRLQRAGPNLLGPRGLCTTVGVMLQCP